MSDELCRRARLAAGHLIRVDLCSCGHVHLMVGPFSARLKRPMFEELREVVDEAARRLQTPGLPAPADAPAGRPPLRIVREDNPERRGP